MELEEKKAQGGLLVLRTASRPGRVWNLAEGEDGIKTEGEEMQACA
jgi:hypothetical protein